MKIVPHRDDGTGAGGDKGEGGGTPDSAQRPSSLRKHPKHPRSSGAGRFETPVNSGRHWDASDGEIVLPEVVQQEADAAVVEDKDTDEVEYGAPNTLGAFGFLFLSFEGPRLTMVVVQTFRIAPRSILRSLTTPRSGERSLRSCMRRRMTKL